MTNRPLDFDALLEASEWLQERLRNLPRIDTSAPWEKMMESHAAHRAAAEALADDLRRHFGARIRTDATAARMTMYGVSSSCTSGLAGLFTNWINAAKRKMSEEGQQR